MINMSIQPLWLTHFIQILLVLEFHLTNFIVGTFSFMKNMSIQPLWLPHFIEILLVLEFHLTKFIVGVFSYKAQFRPQISSNASFGRDGSRILKNRGSNLAL